jgi:hypothetical protein
LVKPSQLRADASWRYGQQVEGGQGRKAEDTDEVEGGQGRKEGRDMVKGMKMDRARVLVHGAKEAD